MIESVGAPVANPVVVRELSAYLRWRSHLTDPSCEIHDRQLEAVPKGELADLGLKLSSSKELWACPRCLSDGDRLKPGDVAEAVSDRWDAHASDFENRNPPRRLPR